MKDVQLGLMYMILSLVAILVVMFINRIITIYTTKQVKSVEDVTALIFLLAILMVPGFICWSINKGINKLKYKFNGK